MAQDKHPQGGDLSDMAKDGTSIPSDAGTQRTIPSVPRPDQLSENLSADASKPAGMGAADNATDIPRTNRDTGMGVTGEVITGTGDQMPAQAESKRLYFGANDPLAKGHDRYDKHRRQGESDQEKYAAEGPEVEAAPGEEEETQDALRERRNA